MFRTAGNGRLWEGGAGPVGELRAAPPNRPDPLLGPNGLAPTFHCFIVRSNQGHTSARYRNHSWTHPDHLPFLGIRYVSRAVVEPSVVGRTGLSRRSRISNTTAAADVVAQLIQWPSYSRFARASDCSPVMCFRIPYMNMLCFPRCHIHQSEPSGRRRRLKVNPASGPSLAMLLFLTVTRYSSMFPTHVRCYQTLFAADARRPTPNAETAVCRVVDC